jgi:Ca2+-transporting ATPase
VNDAPALKAADIGIAMGINGTDVAKDSSDMILMDDHFNTIVSAVREGRGIFENIRKFVAYLLSANAMEVMIIFVALLLGWPLPLLPIHLLWINLVTDGLPAVALGIDPSRGNIMTSHPKEFKQQIVTMPFFKFLMVISVMTSIAVLGIIGYMKNDPLHEQTMAFTAIVVFEMIIIWAIRNQYKLSVFSNKYLILAVSASMILHLLVLYLPINIAGTSLQEMFKVTPLSLMDWGIILGVGAVLMGLWKIILPRFVESFNPELKIKE